MALDVAVKAPPRPAEDAPLDTVTLVLLHYEGHFRVLRRSLRHFQHLARHLALQSAVQAQDALSSAISAYCEAQTSFYPPEQTGARLAIALEAFLRQLVTSSELLVTSLAVKTFLHGNVLTSHETTGQSYRDAVESEIVAGEEKVERLEERVAAGCVVEHEVPVTVADGKKKLVLWKFASQGAGLVFSAEFSSGSESGKDEEVDPYSVNSNEVAQVQQDEKEVAHFPTSCQFPSTVEEAASVYGHFVVEKSGVATLQWENSDMSSVVSKILHFKVKVVPLNVAERIIKIADGLSAVDTAEWLYEHVIASEITSLGDMPAWSTDEGGEYGFGEDAAYDGGFTGDGLARDNQIQAAAMERRTRELEEQVVRLGDSLTSTKKELKTALDRVQIAEEIYKANLEAITQLEVATADIPAPKTSKRSGITIQEREDIAAPPAATPNGSGTQPEGTPSSELERVQRLCAGFQEQCLWRSVENIELEAQLAASQVEASSWREKYVEQATQLEALEKQNRTLRSHKKLLVQEVKRLQPYSQVNLSALVQEAQEARMVQRSLQAKLDSRESLVDVGAGPTDFVLVEASDDDNL